MGDQGHLDLQFGFNPILMTQDLQAYASLGLKVAITEADVRTFVETTDRPGAHRPPGHARAAGLVSGCCNRAWL